MAKIIASLSDGRVVPWYSKEDPIPNGFVEVPPELHAKFLAGKIADGVSLAKAALAGEVKADTKAKAAAIPPPAEPSFPSVANLPETGKMRA